MHVSQRTVHSRAWRDVALPVMLSDGVLAAVGE